VTFNENNDGRYVRLIFVDTSALIALADRKDRFHNVAVNYLKTLDVKPGGLVVTRYVVDETFTRLRLTIGHLASVTFGEAIMESNLYTIANVDSRVFKLAWEWFETYQDKKFSFTDCTSFVIMSSLKLDKAFAFDKHFVQAGFMCCPACGTFQNPRRHVKRM
jgi:predicted nucleic acid-binding protein